MVPEAPASPGTAVAIEAPPYQPAQAFASAGFVISGITIVDNLPLPIPDVGEALTRISILSPAAQVAAVIALGCVAVVWIWTRRPAQGPGMETFQLVIGAMNEQAKATNALAEQVEKVVEQNAVILARLPVGSLERVA